MRILHLIASMDPRLGGVCQAVRATVAGLTALGVENEAASLDAPDAAWSQSDSFAVHALGPGRGPWSYSAQLRPWLRQHLPRFDAVVLHGLWLYPGYALRRALRQLAGPRPRFLVMPHGMLDPYFQRASSRRLKAWRNQLYWQLIEHKVVNGADGLLFTCETERLLAHEPFAPYRPRREMVVGLGVPEPPLYTPAMQAAFLAQCPELKGRPYLLFLSRIHEKKGVELLVQAHTQLTHEGHATPALVVAGPGLNSPYGQAVQQLAAGPGAPAVFFPGMLTGDAKWGAFYGCEAFVLPSHQENFGIAVAEALACGKPVLISNQVNIWREVTEANAGLVANDTAVGTPELLTRWGQATAQEKYAMAVQARQLYEQRFALETAALYFLNALK